MKNIIKRSSTVLKINLWSLLLLFSCSALAQTQNQAGDFLSLDTTCIVSNESINREGLFLELSVDTLFNKAIVDGFDLELVDSSEFKKYITQKENRFYQQACDALKVESDSLLILQNDQFEWMFTAAREIDKQEAKLIGYDIRKYYKVEGVLSYYKGFIPELNLAMVNLVDVDGAYATTHLIDIKSGKMIEDLSENDNGIEKYVANKKYIAYYTNYYYENYQSDFGLISIDRKSNKKYCLTMKGGIQMNDYLIYNLVWMNADTLIMHLRKLTPAEEDVYLKIRVN